MREDKRWEQRLANYVKALNKLSQAITYIRHHYMEEDHENYNGDWGNVLDEMVKEALIQRFEYTHELAWNVMKDYAVYQGNANVGGSRDATREAFQLKLISDGDVWMEMISSRNITTHTYKAEVADEIYAKILNEYYPAFLEFNENMMTKSLQEKGRHKG